MTGYIIIMSTLIVISGAYAGGRLQQRRRAEQERGEAWRDGYAEASETLFARAVRAGRRRIGESTTDILAVPQPPVLTSYTVEPVATAPSKAKARATGVSAVTRPGDPCEATVTAITDAPSLIGGRHSFELRYEQTRPLSWPGDRAV